MKPLLILLAVLLASVFSYLVARLDTAEVSSFWQELDKE